MLEQKERQIEQVMMSGEDLRATSVLILEERDQATKTVARLETIVENQHAKIYLLDQELQKSEKDLEEHKEIKIDLRSQLEKLKEDSEQKLQQLRKKSEADKKLYIDKIDEQGAKIKGLASKLGKSVTETVSVGV